MYLANMSVVFNSADLIQQPTCSSLVANNNNNYDKLDRALITSTLSKSNQQSTTTATKITTPTYLRHQTTCRISIYNGHTKIVNRKHYSSSQLNESQTYDSIIC